jgi:hypothetical protein
MDNTVGSLTQLQKSVVIGSLLGDGYIRKMPGRKDAFLEINHSITQREYVDWKYSILQSISKSAPKERNSNGRRIAYRFYTRQFPEITTLMNIWYAERKKSIPKDIAIDHAALAVWFMDDGSMCRESDVYINTQQFDLADQNVLLGLLRRMGLEASLNKDKQYHRIRLRKSSVPILKKLIKNHIVPSMRYKIGL